MPASGKALCNGQPAKLIWQIQFLVKDLASQINKNFYRVLLQSGVDGHGSEFFGGDHPPSNLHKNETEFKYISEKLTNLLRFNVWVDAVLTRKGNYFIIKDTTIANQQAELTHRLQQSSLMQDV
jgi:hypothetical protein